MYLNHFKLNQKPFENTTNPRFFWLNETFAEAHSALEYGLQESKGFMLLTGDSGCGKSTLIQAFLETVPPEVAVAVIPDPDMEALDFFNYLAMELGWQQTFANKGDFLIFFKRYLHRTVLPANGKVLLVVDEAQRSSSRLLTDIRLLDNLGDDAATAVNIVLAGQPDLIKALNARENLSLKSRIAVDIRIEPLNASDTDRYIQHRMDQAGAKARVFMSEAITAIHQSAAGNPLQINNICDRALLTAYAEGSTQVSADMIRESAEELGISLDINTEISEDAVQPIEADEAPDELDPAESPDNRPIKLFVLALAGVALVILLQMSLFHRSVPDTTAEKEHALSTFESYQQQLEKVEAPEVSTF